MSKDTDANRLADPNQDGMVQPPPPSYTTNNPNTSSFQPPAGQPSTAFYQAHPVSGQQSYAPPDGAYMPSSSSGYVGGVPPPPPGVNPHTVIYVVDGNDPNNQQQVRPRAFPIAMICFIFGICTWLGYLFGMCFLRSKDPRERFWARTCALAAMIYTIATPSSADVEMVSARSEE